MLSKNKWKIQNYKITLIKKHNHKIPRDKLSKDVNYLSLTLQILQILQVTKYCYEKLKKCEINGLAYSVY